jgi:membrane associated rhomboid family serine protease
MSTAETRLPTCYRHPDRETGLSCSECGRPICTECMTPAAVGIRCPEHAGNARRIAPPRIVRRTSHHVLDSPVTKILIAVNIGVYLITAVQGNGINSPGGSLYIKWIMYGPLIDHGDWWRLITPIFLHGYLLHLGFNMFALWVIGKAVENYLGTTRFVLLYFISGLAGSAGALVQAPLSPAVGASGAIFGILGAMLILEWQHTGRFGGQAATLIVINLVLNFAYNGVGGNISIGAHIGGLIGGILVTLAFANWGRGHAAYGKVGLIGGAGLLAVVAGSIAIAYLRVRGLAG